MDWLTFIAEMLKILIWPIIVVAIILLLRRQITNLIPNLRHIKFKDFELEFAKDLQKVNQHIKQLSLPKYVDNEDLKYKAGELKNLAYNSTRGAILEMWLLIENQLQEIANKKLGDVPNKYSVRTLLELLFKEKIIPQGIYSIFKELRAIRNKTIHEDEFDINISQADEYIDMSFRFLAYLKSIS